MSLNWNVEKCDPSAKHITHFPVTQSLIFASMAVGLGSITAKNVKEWRVRLAMWAETVDGEAYGPLRDLSAAEWERRYGLTTNVTTETRSHFRNRVARMIENCAERVVREADRKVVETAAQAAERPA